ncbi:MAG: hypothetical protein AAF658_19210, partial [Myxococcota bacterium]
MAHEILKNARSIDRRRILEQSRSLLKRSAVEEQRRIAAQLKTLGIDWSDGAKPNGGSATVKLTDNTKGGTIAAGELLTLSGSVTNTGTEPLYRVYGVTDSENPLLRNQEFVFGKLDPGQSRTWSVDVKLPQDMSSRADKFSVTIRDMNKVLTNVTAERVISIVEEAKPRFSFQVRVDDRKGGNGDGVLQFGESVELSVNVKNDGPGKAHDASATVKNLSHGLVFLDRGRSKFGEIAAGSSANGALSFAVKRPARRRDYVGEEIDTSKASLRLTVWDTVLGEPVTETLEIPVVEPRVVKRERRSVKIPGGARVSVHSGADVRTPAIATATAGTILRSDAVTDGWRRVELSKGSYGFVREEQVKVVAGGRKPGDVTLSAGISAPSIDLDLDDLVTGSPTLRLTGTVQDDEQ